MVANNTSAEVFEPTWAVPPGATIAAILSARSLPRESFAEAIGESVETVHRLLLGLEPINANLARRLSRYLGASQAFWEARELQYRLDVDRLHKQEAIIQRERWVRQFPIREMAELGWVGNFSSLSEAADECLKLFDVSDVPTWEVRYAAATSAAAFRISSAVKTNPGAVTAWLRWAELLASRIHCANWDAAKFRQQLSNVRRLTWQKDPAVFLPRLRRLCAEAGVAVVVARTPKGCPASGATRFISPSKAMIVLSFRYRSDDQFWFTFFHEAAHVLLHGPDALFLEDGAEVTSEEEQQANQFAQEILIPDRHSREFSNLRLEKSAIIRFAKNIGIAPGLIVGQLQHAGCVAHDRLNLLKRRYQWDQIETACLIP